MEENNNNKKQRKCMNETQTADYLALSTETLQRLRGKGGGPIFIKNPVCRRVLYDITDFDVWMSERKVRNTVQGCEMPNA